MEPVPVWPIAAGASIPSRAKADKRLPKTRPCHSLKMFESRRKDMFKRPCEPETGRASFVTDCEFVII
jgi:hypothetical protein